MKEEKQISEAAPYINVTPLIDVLLVLLIIFMAISPLKPSRFEAKVPAEPNNDPRIRPHIDTLVVTIKEDLSLKLNGVEGLGSVGDSSKLSAKLVEIFQERKANRVYDEALKTATYLSEDERVLKTVYIKAPRSIRYGEIAKVIDSLKGAGANPVGLQIDDLN
jgi:biopolymer transport protein ExbD